MEHGEIAPRSLHADAALPFDRRTTSGETAFGFAAVGTADLTEASERERQLVT